jgi:hypothetical protein
VSQARPTRSDRARQVLAEHEPRDPHTAGQVRRAIGGALVADRLVGLRSPYDGRRPLGSLLATIATAVLLFAGLVFALVGAVIGLSGPDTDATTSGRVVSVDRHPSMERNRDDTCSIAATFAVDGRTYTARSRVSTSGNCERSTGGTVEVRYRSADPSENSVGMGTGLFGLIFVAAGGVLVLVGLVLLLVRAASALYGLRLWVSGSRMVRTHPRTRDDTAVVEEARRAIHARLTGPHRTAAVSDLPVPR